MVFVVEKYVLYDFGEDDIVEDILWLILLFMKQAFQILAVEI